MKALTFTLLLLVLSGCGFRPLYESQGSAEAMRVQLYGVEVAPMPDRLGQVMRNRLLEWLDKSASPTHRLEVTLDSSEEVFGIRPDESAAQEQVTLIASVRLVDLNTDEAVWEQSLRGRTSYDLVLSDFSNVMQREDANRRLALDLASQIHSRLALYFSDL